MFVVFFVCSFQWWVGGKSLVALTGVTYVNDAPFILRHVFKIEKKTNNIHATLDCSALWVRYRIDPLPCHACRKRRQRQDQLTQRIKGLA